LALSKASPEIIMRLGSAPRTAREVVMAQERVQVAPDVYSVLFEN
jgi:hypothetical protein